jgi:hypothetical protein
MTQNKLDDIMDKADEGRLVTAKAISNLVPHDGRHVLFIDYDNYLLSEVVKECRVLIRIFELSNFYIFETSLNHYFAICLKMNSYFDTVTILNTTHGDRKFIRKHRKDGFTYKCDLFRYTNKGKIPKPKYLRTVYSRFRKGEHSYAHMLFLARVFGVPPCYRYKYDLNKKLNIQTYKTKVI